MIYFLFNFILTDIPKQQSQALPLRERRRCIQLDDVCEASAQAGRAESSRSSDQRKYLFHFQTGHPGRRRTPPLVQQGLCEDVW